MTGLELVVNPDPVKSEVMTRASELKDQGYDRSEALSMAWDDVLSEDYGEDEEDDDIDLDLIPQSRKTRRTKNMSENPQDGTVGMILLGAALAYLIWAAIRKSWTPWKAVPVSRQLARVVSQPVRPGATVIDRGNQHKLYQAKDFTEESIYLITP